MATSPIYNWPEPDNTDLVKNGALAIRTLGDAIDTTMATMVAKTVVDAKGDLIAGTAADTVNRLAVGNNGETLVADSSTSTGLRYQADFAAGKNKILNGDFGIWQRSTSVTINADAAYFAPDRYLSYYNSGGATATWSRQTFTPGTAPVAGYEGTFFNRISATSGGASTELGCGQRIEDVRTFAGQTATFSFWAKADSARTANILALQSFGSGGSSNVTINNSTFSVTTSWTRFTVTISVPSISGKTIGTGSFLAFYVAFVTGNATGSPQLDTWGWQLEAGSVATAFQTSTGTIQGELAACQRYYYRANGSGSAAPWTTAYYYGSTSAAGVFTLPVTMRTTPTFTPSAATIATLYSNGSAGASTAITDNGGNNNTAFILFSRSGTANSAASVTIASGYLEWSSEL
jgi:hypothetical protein